jgi:aryl-phospho-beta-D-glucosidase BglC (GH1 family)
MPLPASAFPLRTSGSKILGADGTPVRLAGVNWGGGQQDECVPYGLDKLHRAEIADRIAAMGLNHVRLPFATGGILNSGGTARTAPAPLARLSANPDLQGLSPWQVLQVLADELTTVRVSQGKDPLYVILNNHLSWPGWCCSDADCNGFWYNDNWPASTFIKCWAVIAARFADNPYVGYDIRNEPRKATIGGAVRTPTWGSGGNTDFRQMYETVTDKIRGAGSDGLCFCEGLAYAGDLTGWRANPVRRPDVVASVHDYSWFHPAGQSQADYDAQMDAKAGYLVTANLAPLWAGEFGANTDVPLASMQSGWLPRFIAYAAKRQLHWCWWELSATAVRGTEPATNAVKVQAGQREAFSLLAGHDWNGTQSDLLAMLAPIMP